MDTYRSFIVPAGEYYIGDPFSILTKSEWDEFNLLCNITDMASLEFKTKPDHFESLIGYYETLTNGTKVLAFFASNGKNHYEDQYGISYDLTKSGMIGLVSCNDISSVKDSVVMLRFTEDTLCFFLMVLLHWEWL